MIQTRQVQVIMNTIDFIGTNQRQVYTVAIGYKSNFPCHFSFVKQINQNPAASISRADCQYVSGKHGDDISGSLHVNPIQSQRQGEAETR
jgi:hypothetical protein